MFLVIAGLIVCPRTYISEAKFFVKIGRESVALDPTATVGATVAIQDSRESEIRSVMDVLESRAILQRVVEKMGSGPILRQSLSAENVSRAGLHFDPVGVARRGLSWLIPSDDVSDEERAIRVLEDSIAIESEKKSSVITIRCESNSPQLSQRIVQILVDTYRNQHVELNSSESYQFFELQTATLRDELEAAMAELSEFKSKFGLATIAGQREILESQINSLGNDLAANAAGLSAADARIAALRRALPDVDVDALNSSTGLTETALNEMRDTLYQLQIRERELSSKYQPSHPALIAIQEQLREVEQILGRQELLIEMAAATDLQARRTSLQATLGEAQKRLQLLNEHEVSVSQLERRVEWLKSNHNTYSEKMEQARVAKALDDEQMTNLKIVQPASFVGKAVRPSRSIVLLLALLASTFGGLSVALACEFIDHSFQTPEQIEATINVPVVLSIPHLDRQRPAWN
jgi:uncharacterized protein involved in exopolysaccharide biosynthesis